MKRTKEEMKKKKRLERKEEGSGKVLNRGVHTKFC